MQENASILLNSAIISKVNYKLIPPLIHPTTLMSKKKMDGLIIFSESDLTEYAIRQKIKEEVMEEFISQTLTL